MNEMFFKIEVHPPKTLKWWRSRRQSIDFDPPYQRKGGLWSVQDKAYLIDSIINGFDVPKLYLADYQYGQSDLNKARLPYAIIDGKQRLEAIFEFFDNTLTLDKKFRWRMDGGLRLGGLSLRDLHNSYPSVAEEFENASLMIMSVFTNDEVLINELFVRLNRSKTLTGAEVRNAMSGMVPNIIRQISNHVVFDEVIRFSTTRAGDANAAAKILLFECHGDPTSTKKKDLDSFASGDELSREHLELAARRAIDTLDDVRDIFLPNDKLLANAGIFPVYYWFVRSVDDFYYSDVRAFLIKFDALRLSNRERQKTGDSAESADNDFALFDNFNRSTNDAGSHRGRVRILLAHFDRFLNDWYTAEEREKVPLLKRWTEVGQ